MECFSRNSDDGELDVLRARCDSDSIGSTVEFQRQLGKAVGAGAHVLQGMMMKSASAPVSVAGSKMSGVWGSSTVVGIGNRLFIW